MTAIQGTNVLSPIVPFDSADTNPTHDEQYGKGGYRTVLTLAERDLIPYDRCSTGMKVKVVQNGVIYTLKSGFSNPLLSTDWEVVDYVESETEEAYSIKENNTEYFGIDTTSNDSGVRLFGNKVLNTLSPITTGDFETTDGLYYWLFDADTEQTGTYNGTSYGGIDLRLDEYGSSRVKLAENSKNELKACDISSAVFTADLTPIGSTDKFCICFFGTYGFYDNSLFEYINIDFLRYTHLGYSNVSLSMWAPSIFTRVHISPSNVTNIHYVPYLDKDKYHTIIVLYEKNKNPRLYIDGELCILLNDGADSSEFYKQITTTNFVFSGDYDILVTDNQLTSGDVILQTDAIIMQKDITWSDDFILELHNKLISGYIVKENNNECYKTNDSICKLNYIIDVTETSNDNIIIHFPFRPNYIYQKIEGIINNIDDINFGYMSSRGVICSPLVIGSASPKLSTYYTKVNTNNGILINNYDINKRILGYSGIDTTSINISGGIDSLGNEAYFRTNYGYFDINTNTLELRFEKYNVKDGKIYLTFEAYK